MNLLKINWHQLLLGDENWSYLPPVLLKSLIMFIVVVVSLRFIGRRGIMQGVFQVLTIIMLGSAAGDPMLYRNVGVLPAIAVFASIVILYKITYALVARFSPLETLAEGRAMRFINEGRFDFEHFKSLELSKDELFSDLRKQGVSQLGQISAAYMEAGGDISIFYYKDEDVHYGLPLFPELHLKKLVQIEQCGIYSCEYCGHTQELPPADKHICPVCNKDKWVKSVKDGRVV